MTRLAILLPLLLLAACRGETDAELVAKAKTEFAKPDLAAATVHLKNALRVNPDSSEARLLLGRTLLAGGDAAAAQIELRRALGSKSLESQAVPELVRAMLALGEGNRAVAEFGERMLDSPEATAEVKTLLARAMAGWGDAERAREALQGALQEQPGYAPAIVLNARLDAAAGQVDTALLRLEEVLAGKPGHEGAGLLKGEILRQSRRDTAGALTLFREVRTAHPRSLQAHLAVVGALLQAGQLAEARAEFTALQTLAPNHPETVLLQAQLLLTEKDFKRSRELAEQLLAKAPNNVRALMLAGAAEVGLQQYALASGLFSRAVMVSPGSPVLRRLLAQSLMKSGDAAKALELLKPMVDHPRVDSDTLGLAGEAWLIAGDIAKAEAAFQRALKSAPDDTRLRTAVALTQLARGDNALALAQLETIAQVDAGAQADLALVSVRLRQKDLAGAMKAIDALQRKQPDQPLPLVLRSRVQIAQGDQASARNTLEAALKLQPNYLPALVRLAALDIDVGQAQGVRKRFDDLVKAEPQNVQARLALAELDRRLGAPDAAVVSQLRQAVRANPSDSAPHLALIERLLASGDAPAAQAAAQDASAVLPNDLAVLEALGMAQQAAGDAQRSISTFKRLAGLQPRNPTPLARLASAQLAANDSAAAAAALQQALAIQPNHLMSQRGLALLAQMDQRPQEALAIARAMQKRMPKDPVGFALEGELESRGSHWAGAAAAYAAALQRKPSTDIAIRLRDALVRAGKAADAERAAADWRKGNPKDTVYLHHLGDVAAEAKDWTRAEALYREVLTLAPRHAAAMNNLALVLSTQKKPGAVAMAEQALAIMPDRAAVLDTLSVAQEAESQLGKAIETQRRAAELEPRNPMLRLRLAQLHLKAGNKSEARDLLQPLVRLGPSFSGQPEVSALMKQL